MKVLASLSIPLVLLSGLLSPSECYPAYGGKSEAPSSFVMCADLERLVLAVQNCGVAAPLSIFTF